MYIICLQVVVTPTVLVVRPTFSVARDHSPSDEQPDPRETAGQAATARLSYLVWTDVASQRNCVLMTCCAFCLKTSFRNERKKSLEISVLVRCDCG